MPKKSNPKNIKQTRFKKFFRVLRSAGIWLAICLSVISVTSLSVIHWTEQNLLNTDKWTVFSGKLLKDEQVTDALASYFTSQVFEVASVEDYVSQALPPRAAFLAQPLTNQLRELTNRTTKELVTSDTFNSVWTGANRIAHSRLIDSARSSSQTEQSPRQVFNIDVSAARDQIRQRLGKSSEVAVPQRDSRALNIKADLQASARSIKSYIQKIDFAYSVLPLFALASILCALALSINRKKTTRYISGGVVLLALAQLAGVSALRPVVINKVEQASYHSAAGSVYDAVLNTFNSIVYFALAVAAIIWFLTILADSKKFKQVVVKYLNWLRFKKTLVFSHIANARRLALDYKLKIWSGLIIVWMIALAFFVDISWASAINSLLLLVSAISLVQIFCLSRLSD